MLVGGELGDDFVFDAVFVGEMKGDIVIVVEIVGAVNAEIVVCNSDLFTRNADARVLVAS